MTKTKKPSKPRRAAPAEEPKSSYRVLRDIEGTALRAGHVCKRTATEAEPYVTAGDLELVSYTDVPDAPPPPRGGLCVALRELRLHQYGELIAAGSVIYLAGDTIESYLRSAAARRVTASDLAPDIEVP